MMRFHHLCWCVYLHGAPAGGPNTGPRVSPAEAEQEQEEKRKPRQSLGHAKCAGGIHVPLAKDRYGFPDKATQVDHQASIHACKPNGTLFVDEITRCIVCALVESHLCAIFTRGLTISLFLSLSPSDFPLNRGVRRGGTPKGLISLLNIFFIYCIFLYVWCNACPRKRTNTSSIPVHASQHYPISVFPRLVFLPKGK